MGTLFSMKNAWKWLFALMLVLPGLAFAESMELSNAPFKLADEDYFLGKIVADFLGMVPNKDAKNIGDVLKGPGTLGEVMRVFNLGVAFFGTIMISFITIVGVVQSGNDGEFLGKRWSSFWVPVRFIAGSALMLPVASTGFCAIQYLILFIALEGVAFADTVWSKVVDVVIVHSGSKIWSTVDADQIAQNVMKGTVCAAAVNLYGKADGTIASDKSVRRYSGYTAVVNPKNTRETILTQYVYWNEDELSKAALLDGRSRCGYMKQETVISQNDIYHKSREALFAIHSGLVNQMSNDFIDPATQFIVALESKKDGDFPAAVENMQSVLAAAGKAYREKLASAADQELQKVQNAQSAEGRATADMMKRYGFVTAGMFYIDMTRAHGAVREAANSTPVYIVGKGMLNAQNFALAMSKFGSITTTAIDSSTEAQTTEKGNASVSSGLKNILSVDGEGKKDLDPESFIKNKSAGIAAYFMKGMFGVGNSNTGSDGGSGRENVFSGFSSANNTSSVLELKNKGDYILDAAGVIMVSKTAVMASIAATEQGLSGMPLIGSWLAAPATFIRVVMEDLSVYAVSAIFGLIAFGLSLSVYLPMVPYMLWIGGIIGLIVLIAEALVAGPLWAVMLMHPAGEGLTSQKAEQGVMLMLNLFTRPALMLMGMVMGIFMLEPLVTLVNDTFFYTMLSVQQATITGLFQFFGFTSLYVSLILTVVNKSFSMIHIVPDKALRWISGGREELGENALRDHAKHNMGSVATTMGQLAMGGGSSGARIKGAKAGKEPK